MNLKLKKMQDMNEYLEPVRYNTGKVDWTLLPWDKELFWDLKEDFHNSIFISQIQAEHTLVNSLIETRINRVLIASIYMLGKGHEAENMYFKALEDVCRVFSYGCVKYQRDNYKLSPGLPLEGYIQSMWRHLVQYLRGEEVDIESKLPHLSHLACNCFMYLWTQKEYHTK